MCTSQTYNPIPVLHNLRRLGSHPQKKCRTRRNGDFFFLRVTGINTHGRLHSIYLPCSEQMLCSISCFQIKKKRYRKIINFCTLHTLVQSQCTNRLKHLLKSNQLQWFLSQKHTRVCTLSSWGSSNSICHSCAPSEQLPRASVPGTHCCLKYILKDQHKQGDYVMHMMQCELGPCNTTHLCRKQKILKTQIIMQVQIL